MEFCGVFIKFGIKEHILKLQKQGLLYCKPISYFTKVEDNFLRGDALETVIEMDYIENGILELKPRDKPEEEFTKFQIQRTKITKSRADPIGNLFCLHAINLINQHENLPFKLDIRNKEFGDYFLLIKDSCEFLRRFNSTLKKLDLKFSYDMVEYIDFSKYKGMKTVFQKDISYQYQKEFRLFISNYFDQPVEIRIGDISDISILYESTLIDTFLMKANKIAEKNQ